MPARESSQLNLKLRLKKECVKAVIFDFDGLMVDTEWAIYTIWRDIYESHSVVLEMPHWIKCVGTHDKAFDPYIHLEKLKGTPVDRSAIRKLYEVQRDERTGSLVLLPGVREKIDQAKELHLSLAVASSSGRTWVENHLERLGIRNEFEAICTKDDVRRVKPDPELYLLATARLGVSPKDSLAFEDSSNGMLAAKGAGCKCIAIPNRVTHASDFTQADKKISSLAEFSLKDLIDSLP